MAIAATQLRLLALQQQNLTQNQQVTALATQKIINEKDLNKQDKTVEIEDKNNPFGDTAYISEEAKCLNEKNPQKPINVDNKFQPKTDKNDNTLTNGTVKLNQKLINQYKK